MERLARYIPMLSVEDQDIYWLRYELHKEEEEIGLLLGMTQQAINHRLMTLQSRLSIRVKLGLTTQEVRERLATTKLRARARERLVQFWATGNGAEAARRCGVAPLHGMTMVKGVIRRLAPLDPDLHQRFVWLLESRAAVRSLQCTYKRGRR
jgi:hypothetical protein